VITENKMLQKAENAKRESKYVDFKERFDLTSSQDWCELIKDIVAMANSGGGVILIGVRNDGMPSGFDVSPVLSLDPAQLTDKIAKYTGEQFSNFEIKEMDRNGHRIAVLLIGGISIPMVFIRPGTYSIEGRKQRTAFGRGTIYFRHGAKSEPGNSNDLRRVIERELERIRKSWLGNIRKVVNAPLGYSVRVLPPEVRVSTRPEATPIRIVEREEAPAYRLETPDSTHPHRQKEVIKRVNERLKGKKTINTFDILCVRRVHKIDETKPQFCYKPKFSSPQYSDDFIDWLVKCYEEDPLFFENTREKYRSLKK
jgi:hypothetical protein